MSHVLWWFLIGIRIRQGHARFMVGRDCSGHLKHGLIIKTPTEGTEGNGYWDIIVWCEHLNASATARVISRGVVMMISEKDLYRGKMPYSSTNATRVLLCFSSMCQLRHDYTVRHITMHIQ